MSVFKKLSQKYRTPKQVQNFISSFEYNDDKKKATLRSALSALKAKKAHCIEAAFIAAAILEHHGYPPLVISLESQDGLDHVLYVFQNKKKLWGAIAQSRDVGLHGRAPVYKTIKALAESYFDPYVDLTGKVTAFQIAHLDDTKSNWRTSTRNVWKAENYLLEIKHVKMKFPRKRYLKLLADYKKFGSVKKQKNWW